MTKHRPARAVAGALLGALLLLAACGGDREASSDDASPTPAIAATARPTAAVPAASPLAPQTAAVFEPPRAALAFDHLLMLASEIGPRVAASEQERRAAQYIAAQLAASGYEVTIEPFEVESTVEQSTVVLPDGVELASTLALLGSPNLTASGPLVRLDGLGRASDLVGLDLGGVVLVVDRGVIEFATKAANAEQAGAVALVIVNNVAGPLARGSLGDATFSIPIVGIARDDAAALDLLAAEGASVEVRADRRLSTAPSQNVVARPAGSCRVLVGAHYDSVARTPGANDNASGVAALIELARTQRAGGLCYVAFGAEEIGLRGSAAFIAEHGTDGLRFMLNLDVVGKLSDTRFIAGDQRPSRELAERAAALADGLGYAIPRGSFPAFASSDHAPFAEAGVPAITITGGSDESIHTPQDVAADISVEALQTMLDVTAALLRDLLPD